MSILIHTRGHSKKPLSSNNSGSASQTWVTRRIHALTQPFQKYIKTAFPNIHQDEFFHSTWGITRNCSKPVCCPCFLSFRRWNESVAAVVTMTTYEGRNGSHLGNFWMRTQGQVWIYRALEFWRNYFIYIELQGTEREFQRDFKRLAEQDVSWPKKASI